MQEVTGDLPSATPESKKEAGTQGIDSKLHLTEKEEIGDDADVEDEADEAGEADEEDDEAGEADEEDEEDEDGGGDLTEKAEEELLAAMKKDGQAVDESAVTSLLQEDNEAGEADEEDDEADDEADDDNEADEEDEKDNAMQPPGVDMAEAAAKFEAEEKKMYDDAVVANNCDTLQNPTSFHKCKDKLKEDAEKAKEVAKEATATFEKHLGKLSPVVGLKAAPE